MYTLIVLGIVPGTTVQITFDMWLWLVTEVFVGLALLWTLLKISQHRRQRTQIRAITRLHLQAQ